MSFWLPPQLLGFFPGGWGGCAEREVYTMNRRRESSFGKSRYHIPIAPEFCPEFRNTCWRLGIRSRDSKMPWPLGIWDAFRILCRKTGFRNPFKSWKHMISCVRDLEGWWWEHKQYLLELRSMKFGSQHQPEKICRAKNRLKLKLLPKSPNTLSKDQKKIFFESREWQALRYSTIAKYGRRCMCCGKYDGVMHVDHIKPIWSNPELRLDPDNVQVLCSECNNGKGARDATDWRPKQTGIESLIAEFAATE